MGYFQRGRIRLILVLGACLAASPQPASKVSQKVLRKRVRGHHWEAGSELVHEHPGRFAVSPRVWEGRAETHFDAIKTRRKWNSFNRFRKL